MATPAEQVSSELPTIALVGRVNVGKSSLFNRLIEKKHAIVSDTPGTTRTSNVGLIRWRGKAINIVDTGGLTFSEDIPLEKEIIDQTMYAIEHADLVIFVTDAKTGILPQERELARRLRKSNKPVLLTANKVDTSKIAHNLYDSAWQGLGLGDPFPVSATSGRNLGDFLDLVYTKLHSAPRRPKSEKVSKHETINISLIGKPNVGKSSLFNKLIGEDKVIVSEMAHTTREPHDTLVKYETEHGTININFIDTAGIRRKSKVAGKLEQEGIQKSIQKIDESDIVLFIIDGAETISTQDKQLGGLLEKHSKSTLILVNKWDLSEEKDEQKQIAVKRFVHNNFPHLNFAPIFFVSGKTGQNVHKVFPAIMKAWHARHIEIPRRTLEKFLEIVIKKHQPSRGKGTRHPKIMGMRQKISNPPIFEMVIKYRTSLHRSYLNFLENKLREQFDFYATPIVIKLKKSKQQ